MVEIKNVSFSYQKNTVLKDISLTLEDSKLYGIIGPNGCGKSTLLKIISGILKPDMGSVLIDNQDISLINPNYLAHKLSFMPQSRPVPDMTVEDFVLCGRFPYRNLKDNTAQKDKEILNNALLLTDTSPFIERRITHLSGGERQRVYLALLLAQQTNIVLCDEPNTYLDIKSNLSVMNILSGMRDSGKGVITVLHDLVSALKFCDEIILMDKGRIIDVNPPEEIVKRGNIDKVFGISCMKIKTERGINYIFEE